MASTGSVTKIGVFFLFGFGFGGFFFLKRDDFSFAVDDFFGELGYHFDEFFFEFKRQTKKKVLFPNEEALERYLVTLFEDYNFKQGN